jgi:hypothetical protein
MSSPPDNLSQNKSDSTIEATQQPNTERVLSVLASEIENIRSSQTQQGWTSWGLVGGIIGALWLLSDEL